MTQTQAQSLPIDRTTPFDPPAALEAFRQAGPISPLHFPDGHVGWLVTDHAMARRVLADSRFSARQELRRFPLKMPRLDGPIPPAQPGMFIRMDEPDHGRYRRLLTGQFTVRRMNQLTPRIQQITEDRLDEMEKAGPPVDLVQAFALPIPSLVICELLGVPYEDRENFQHTTSKIVRLSATAEEIKAAMDELNAYLDGLIDRKRGKPADDVLSGLIEGGELDQEELRNMAMLLLAAGHETTANMLSLGTFALLQHPDQLEVLRNEPDLIENAVEELLRYLSIIHIGPARAALEDVDLDGVRVQQGDTVVISTPMANRDPERFESPDELDLHHAVSGHLAFGHGVHQCLGQQLARIEMRVGYATLFRRFPNLRLAVPASEVPLKTDMAIYGLHQLPVTW
jgi:cytochrome P450